MRNTPYPRYSVGNAAHRIFDLHETRGLVQGITGVSELSEIKVSDLSKFQHLKPGETKNFDKEKKVEIVSFGGHHSRGGFISELEAQVFTLEAGAKFTGPIAWRPLDEDEIPSVRKGDGMSDADATILLGVVLSIIAATAFLSLLAAAISVGLIVFFAATFFIWDACDTRARRSIEKLGSIYVYAPSNRTWNAEITA